MAIQAKTVLMVLAALLVCSCGVAQAQTVYKSVDENGNVTFSDTPPADDRVAEQLELNVPAPAAPEDQAQYLQDMRETTDRMAADRREREKHRAEVRELNARAQSYTTTGKSQSESTVDDYYTTVPGYTVRSGYYYGPHRPGYKPRPEHPVARPPLRPVPLDGFSNNSQLMRPLVSGNSSARTGGR
jgi:cell division protein FtsN